MLVDIININICDIIQRQNMRRTSNKNGSMLMMVIIMLVVAAIIAMKLMPDEQTQTIRENEAFYNSDLSQLREAIDLARLAASSSTPLPDWEDFCASDTPDTISAKIASLSAWGFLRKNNIKDNSIPDHLWGTSTPELLYWKVSTNYASNTSFELASGDMPIAWEKGKDASATFVDNIKLNTLAIDEYPYQNKLGDSTRGENAIGMIRIDRVPHPPAP